jgi:hypothetical protein
MAMEMLFTPVSKIMVRSELLTDQMTARIAKWL